MALALEQKAFALDAPTNLQSVTTSTGDLIVSGMAAVWDGLDFDNENFLRGAFKEALPEFLNAPSGAPLCFHHEASKAIGQVVDLKETNAGLSFKALVLKQEPSSPLYYIYDAIRRGIYKGVSVGGYFTRKLTENGYRISKARLTEVSITPRAMHPGTFATAVEVKALRDFCVGGTCDVRPDIDSIAAQLADLERSMLLYEARELLRKVRG